MKQPSLTYPSQLVEIAKETIFEQRSLLMAIRRTAWWLCQHEMSRGYSPYAALEHTLKWMAEQAEMLERVKHEPTQMQRRLLQMLADGYTQKQIADELGKNIGTVKKNFCNIRTRMGAESMWQVVAIASKKGWIKVYYDSQGRGARITYK